MCSYKVKKIIQNVICVAIYGKICMLWHTWIRNVWVTYLLQWKLYLFYIYHFHNFGQSLKFRGGADSWESRGEGCSNRWKRPHRIQGHPAVCRVYFPLHPARYEPVSTYLGPHSRRTHVPLVRHPPSLDIKANRNTSAIRRHRLAWEHKAKWQYTRSDARTWPALFQDCDSIDDNGPTLRQHCVLAVCEMLFVQPITQS